MKSYKKQEVFKSYEVKNKRPLKQIILEYAKNYISKTILNRGMTQ